ncbi:MAG: hypothetical protein KTR31_31165 [Myxococcales bacterium]|nr:hypothetical protein [Myxococcales bacterium]
MTWFEDLSPCDYHRHPALAPLAVGWLEADHPFETGDVDARTVQQLFELLRDPWQPSLFLGWHDCSMCGGEGPSHVELAGEQVAIGTRNLFVPDLQHACVYIAPSMILHYVRDHHYAPPERFLAAVRACPPMGSTAYAQAMKRAATGP